MSEKKLPEWLEEKNKLVEQNRASRIRDVVSPLILPEGVTTVKFDLSEKPRQIGTKYGMREVFTVYVDGGKWAYFLNPKSPLYSNIIKKLVGGIIEIKIQRDGQGKDSRYSISN